MVIEAVLAAILYQGAGTGDRYPNRVRNLLNPQRPGTSQVEWTLSWVGGYDDGLVERYVTRTAGDTVWESNLGDENGYHRASLSLGGETRSALVPGPFMSRDEVEKMGLPEVPKELGSGTRHSMIHEGEVWNLNADKPVSGFLAPAGSSGARAPIDPQSVGLRAGWQHDYPTNPFGLDTVHAAGLDTAAFSVTPERGRPTVSVNYAPYRLTWTFDDNQGGQPVEAVLYGNGNDRPLYYSQTEYQQVAERWVPMRVRFYQGDSAAPYKIIDVRRATFDEPWHLKEITPDHIGRVYGTVFSTPSGHKVWNGFELADSEEFWEITYLYGLLPDRRILAVQAKLAGVTFDEYVDSHRHYGDRWRKDYFQKHGDDPWLVMKSPNEKDEWDLYVEKFLAKHKLPEPGVKRANEIRDQAKKLRDAYRRKNAAGLRKATEENDPRKIAEYEGIEKRIFDRVLVRELERLVQDEKKLSKKEP